MKNQLKKLDLSKKSFPANGKEYFWTQDLSLDMYIEFEKLQLEIGFDLGFDGMFKFLKELYSTVNDQKFADAAVSIYNMQDRIKKGVESRIMPMYKLITLFFWEKDEDKRYYKEERMSEKIQDLKEEGYEVGSLFQLAFNLIPNFITNYQEHLAGTSQKKGEGKSKTSEKK